ncbi:MAG: hypothetical protein A07HR60_02869 [uncultured archaeon A07HR60]|nr:MAG: hypothetical protein A07HR60_02869 [uncultured archaeon A07HR60]
MRLLRAEEKAPRSRGNESNDSEPLSPVSFLFFSFLFLHLNEQFYLKGRHMICCCGELTHAQDGDE